MSKEFEFKIVGDTDSFLRMLDKNNIEYAYVPLKKEREEPRILRPRLRTQQRRAVLREVLAPTMTIDQLGDLALKFIVALTPFALDKIWKWYKRKRKSTSLSVIVDGNLLDLSEENMEILMKLFKTTSKKKRRKRGEPK